jgi:hypothetical protein
MDTPHLHARDSAAPAEGPDEVLANLPGHLLKKLGSNASVYVERSGAVSEPAHHNALLVGNLGSDGLLLRVFDGMEFDVGQPIVAHIALTPHLAKFRSQVLSRIAAPPLYLIRFPERLEVVDVRKMKRLKTYFPAELRSGAHGNGAADALHARVLDIGAGGLSFRSKLPLSPAEPVQVSFSLPGDGRTHSIKATVIESSTVGSVYHSRAKFDREPAQDPVLQAVEHWVLEGLTFTPEMA